MSKKFWAALRNRRVVYYGLLLTLLTGSGCGEKTLPTEGGRPVAANEATAEVQQKPSGSMVEMPPAKRGYAVSTSNDLATDVAMSIMEQGGNAADAAVAIAFTLGVVEPYGSGLGGSGGMVIYDTNTGESWFYDYRAAAGAAQQDLVNVPGMVSGMYQVWRDKGSLPWERLLQPAIDYANKGFEVNEATERRLKGYEGYLSAYKEFYNENGEYLVAGDTMVQMELADTLRIIQNGGADAFYNGEIAESIVRACGLTEEDLSGYRTIVRDPVEGTYLGNRIISANAPLGGVTLVQELMLSEIIDVQRPEDDIADYMEKFELVSKCSINDRYHHLADKEFVDYEPQEHLTEDYLRKLLGKKLHLYEEDEESIDTTSFSVADTNGMVISCTNTLSSFWGSKIMVRGIILNNTESNFGSAVNKREPGKRSRTYTAPTIIVKEDGTVISIGSPGGNYIPSILYSVITALLRDNISPQQALDRGRILYSRGNIVFESGRDIEERIDITSLQQNVAWGDTKQWWFGAVSLAGIQDGQAFAAYDTRRSATKCGVYNE